MSQRGGRVVFSLFYGLESLRSMLICDLNSREYPLRCYRGTVNRDI